MNKSIKDIIASEYIVQNEYNLNPLYIKKIIKMKGVTTTELMTLFNRSIAATYARLSGNKPISLEEGFKLANLLQIDINRLFAPTQQDVMNVVVHDKL